MNIAELKLKIISNELPNFMVFTGEEFGVMNIYLNDIIKNFDGSIHKLEYVKDSIKMFSSNSIISKKKLVIITDDYGFMKEDSAWPKIIDLVGNNILILKYHQCDSRLGFWKYFKDKTVVFEKMSQNVLSKHLMKLYELDNNNAIQISEFCNNDYNKCLLEMEKVKVFSKLNGLDINSAFLQCIKNGVLCINQNVDILTFVDYVLTKNFKCAIKSYKKLLMENEPVLKIISFLYNGFKNVLVAQTMSSAKNIKQNSGISYYSFIKAKEFCGYYTNEKIEDIMYLLMNIEQGIKKGTFTENIAVDFLLINL